MIERGDLLYGNLLARRLMDRRATTEQNAQPVMSAIKSQSLKGYRPDQIVQPFFGCCGAGPGKMRCSVPAEVYLPNDSISALAHDILDVVLLAYVE